MRLLTLFLMLGAFVQAQTPSWDWATGTGFYLTSDYCAGIASDANGYTFITGTFQDTLILGVDTLTNKGTRNHVIYYAKLDPAGNFMWAKTPPGDYGADANAICLDQSGHLVITGTYQGELVFGNDTLAGNTLLGSFFIVKIDTSGAPMWSHNASCGWKAEGKSVAADDDGSIFATGTFEDSGIVFGPDTLISNFSTDVFLVKYDANGNILWARGAGSTGGDQSNSVAVTAEGHVFITGSFRNSIDFSGTTLVGSTNGAAAVFLVQYDAVGNLVWAKSSGGFPSSGEGNGVSSDSFGNVFITGYYNSPVIYFGSNTLTNAGANDLFVVKYDSSGTVLWAYGNGGPNFDQATDVLADGAGGCYVSGTIKSSGVLFGTQMLIPQANDVFVSSFNGTGSPVWAVQSTGSLNELSTGLAMDYSGNLYVSGNYSSPVAGYGTHFLTNTDPFLGSYDIFVSKLGTGAMSSVELVESRDQLVVFPHPMYAVAEIRVGQVSLFNGKLSLYDTCGRQVLERRITDNGPLLLERGSLHSGLYQLSILTEKGQYFVSKLLIE